MKIEYDILWIEDNLPWINSIRKTALAPLKDIGLEPVVKIAKNQVEAIEQVNRTQFDLILVDYRLDGSTGDNVIEAIRRKNQFTTILFYSSDGDVKIRKHISSKAIDGVFCADRKRTFFIKAVHDLIKISTKMFQHINNIRGLAMAEVSDMEETMQVILNDYFETNSDETAQKLKASIFKNLKKSASKNFRVVEELIKSEDISAILKSRLFDADKKAAAIQKLAELMADDMQELHEFHKTYQEKISNKRNVLGHTTGELEEGLMAFKDNKGNKMVCDEEFCIMFRGDLRAHKQLLRKLRDFVNSSNGDAG